MTKGLGRVPDGTGQAKGAIARWRCETCRGELSMPVELAERGYACCYASMTFIGVETTARAEGIAHD